ncbi:MAG: ATPase [Calditrichaeota bacterium]|nr:MAG: ATPase [Calditrichota bacterium]
MAKRSHFRKDRLIQQKRHDAYQEVTKLPEPTECQKCHAVYVGGRWTWKRVKENSHQTTCPACLRIEQNFPAGIVELSGAFFLEHRGEILNLVRNIEEKEKDAHPLERIMKIEDDNSSSIITTTGIHLARRIGEALHRAYKGDYNFQYGDQDKQILVKWER